MSQPSDDARDANGEGAVSSDPLAVFVARHRRALPPSRGKRFNAGEHAWLAGHGAEKACKSLHDDLGIVVDKALFSAIARRSGPGDLQYGELVALSGDFYGSPEALFEEKPSPVPWLWESNDLSDLRQIFAKELRWIEDRRRGRRTDTYPDENLRLAWNAKSYVELALDNTDHFGWHNVVRYVECHAEALRLAVDARQQVNETFRRALCTNAFADHFLTDGFAAGHVRVPRAEIREWAARSGLGEKVAGALSKFLHDQDGHVDTLHGNAGEGHRDEHDGLRVRDSTGASWTTYCDGQLFLRTGGSMAVERAVDAVSLSVRELLIAWKRRETPPGIYAATRRVPFPDPQAPTLIEKFPADLPDARIGELWKSIQWYAKIRWLTGLDRDHLVALFRELPAIMESFRARVAAASTAPEIRKRVDPTYIAAYRRVA